MATLFHQNSKPGLVDLHVTLYLLFESHDASLTKFFAESRLQRKG